MPGPNSTPPGGKTKAKGSRGPYAKPSTPPVRDAAVKAEQARAEKRGKPTNVNPDNNTRK